MPKPFYVNTDATPNSTAYPNDFVTDYCPTGCNSIEFEPATTPLPILTGGQIQTMTADQLSAYVTALQAGNPTAAQYAAAIGIAENEALPYCEAIVQGVQANPSSVSSLTISGEGVYYFALVSALIIPLARRLAFQQMPGVRV